MKVLLCPDSFKGSLDAATVANALANGWSSRRAEDQLILLPLSDGGEGCMQLLAKEKQLNSHTYKGYNSLNRSCTVSYYSDDERTAYVESASFIGFVEGDESPILRRSSFGIGEFVRSMSPHYRKICIGLGGSATCDGGIGFLAGLGYSFTDNNGESLEALPLNLNAVENIKKPLQLNNSLPQLEFWCDVRNPLLGETGAAVVFAPQKGAGEEEVDFLEKGLSHFCQEMEAFSGRSIATLACGGAAGGIGAAAVALCEAELFNGFQAFSAAVSLEESIKAAGLVLSGEGRFDEQSTGGKVVGELMKLCDNHQKPLIILCGSTELSAPNLFSLRQINPGLDTFKHAKEAIANGSAYIATHYAKDHL